MTCGSADPGGVIVRAIDEMSLAVFERLGPESPDFHIVDENRSVGLGDPSSVPPRIAQGGGCQAVTGICFADKPELAIGEAFGKMKSRGRQVRIALVSDGLLEELIDRLEEHILFQYLGLGVTPFGDIFVHAAVADKRIAVVQNGYGIGLQADQTAVLAQVPVHQIHEGLSIRHQLAVDLADTSGFMPGHKVEWRFPEYLGAFVSQDLFHLARGKCVDVVLVALPDPVRRAHGDVLKPLLGVFQLVQDLLLARYIPVDSEDHLEYTSHEDGRSDDGNGDFPAVLAPADGFEGDLFSADNFF